MVNPGSPGGKFAQRYRKQPRIFSAPGRVNLIGEHTDYNDGFVLPMAIDRWAVIVADFVRDGASTIIAADLSHEISIDLHTTLAPSHGSHRWVNHLTGVAEQFKARGVEVPNADVLLTSTVPIGAGLASSAAIEVAMATLLEEITGMSLDHL